jgi:5-methylcytosine-specific restriction endonuclease McrA
MSEVRLTAAQRAEVVERAHGCCEYCLSQERFSPDSFSVEHIVPLSKAGTHESLNLAFSCQGCNNHKYTSTEALDPVTQTVVPLFHPRQHNWLDHFGWSTDCSQVLGLTAIGRATIEKLQFNRPGLINLRRVLFEAGEHPPVF